MGCCTAIISGIAVAGDCAAEGYSLFFCRVSEAPSDLHAHTQHTNKATAAREGHQINSHVSILALQLT